MVVVDDQCLAGGVLHGQVEGEHHVLGCHLAAVVELDAVLEGEGVTQAVLGDGPLFGQAGLQGAVGVKEHQGVIDIVQDQVVVAVGPLGAAGEETGGLAAGSQGGEILAGRARHAGGRRAAAGGGGRSSTAARQQGNGQGGRQERR